MEAYELAEVSAARRESNESYLQFLNTGSLSVGLYVLPAGGEDTQAPHAEDEVYYVLSGRAIVRVAGEERPVVPGSLVFVAADVDHRFVDIAEELSLLVFFAPEHKR
jgi:mannose-6-phosphate isomerase-like protein (cupin superfamily)